MNQPSTHVNIDGDVVLYSVGFASQTTYHVADGKRFADRDDCRDFCERYDLAIDDIIKEYEAEPIEFALSSVKRLLARIKEGSKATTSTVLLTGGDNFRDGIATIQPYKGNRLDAPKPVHYQAIKDYLIQVHGAEVVEGEEADDQLSIRCVQRGDTIATIDKDLRNTSGWHYNWQKDELDYVGPHQADRNFYKQLITGDSTDHIPGLFRITGVRGKKAWKDALDDMTEPMDMWKHVLNVYMDALKIKWQKAVTEDIVWDKAHMAAIHRDCTNYLIEIGRLLWMRREEEELWLPPGK